ncbi:MAG: LysR family transcriptional regulator [Oscillospiraceae bacterium]|nr:LysR family transcriptional regulator [Oscillospiraceae bacterium]
MQLKQLIYFSAVAEARSFSHAAKKLYVAQPTLNQSVQALEKELGFQLFTRMPYHLVLTEMGEIVYQDAKKLLAETEDMQKKWMEMDQARKALKGTIRLVAYPSAYCFISDQILHFQNAYPNMIWQVSESRGYNFPDVFSHNRADIGVGDYITAKEDAFQTDAAAHRLCVIPLCSDICKVAISRKNPLSAKHDISKTESAKLSLAYYSGGDDVVVPYFSRFFNERLAIELHSFEKIVDSAVSGIAVSPVAQKITTQGLLSHYKANAVNFLTVEGFSLPVTHCLIYPSDTVFSPELKQAKELIIHAFHNLEQVSI